jgi:hypothetical protein
MGFFQRNRASLVEAFWSPDCALEVLIPDQNR